MTLVRASVQVSEGNKQVTGLRKEDFVLLVDERPVPIDFFGRQSDPLSLLLLLDVSGSMRKYVEQMGRAAQQAMKPLQAEDRVATMIFSRQAELREDFTSDRRLIEQAILRSARDENLGGGTAINAALMQAAQLFDKSDADFEKGRRAIVILTDNLSLNYQSPDEDVIRELQNRNVVMDAIVVGKGKRPEPVKAGRYVNPDFTPADVFHIADETGGEAVRAEHVEATFAPMLERIRTRYELQFRPQSVGGNHFHKLRVTLSPEAQKQHPKAVIRTRSGYFGE